METGTAVPTAPVITPGTSGVTASDRPRPGISEGIIGGSAASSSMRVAPGRPSRATYPPATASAITSTMAADIHPRSVGAGEGGSGSPRSPAGGGCFW